MLSACKNRALLELTLARIALDEAEIKDAYFIAEYLKDVVGMKPFMLSRRCTLKGTSSDADQNRMDGVGILVSPRRSIIVQARYQGLLDIVSFQFLQEAYEHGNSACTNTRAHVHMHTTEVSAVMHQP